MGAHTVEIGQAFGDDRASDRSLADAVAATDFCIIRQGCNGRHRVQGGTALIGLAEDQRVAHLPRIGALADHVEEPRAVRSFAIEHRADDAIVLEHQALVDA